MTEFSTSQYQFSHGATPRGDGYWGFQYRGREFWTFGMYGEAKRKAAAAAREDFPGQYVLVEVLP